jgi:fumarylacetoacetase
MTEGGTIPLNLPGGEQRSFLEDGDEVILTARAQAKGYVSIGFGEARGEILPAL